MTQTPLPGISHCFQVTLPLPRPFNLPGAERDCSWAMRHLCFPCATTRPLPSILFVRRDFSKEHADGVPPTKPSAFPVWLLLQRLLQATLLCHIFISTVIPPHQCGSCSKTSSRPWIRAPTSTHTASYAHTSTGTVKSETRYRKRSARQNTWQ